MKRSIYFISARVKDWLHVLGLTILGIGFYSPLSLLSAQSLKGLIISALYLAHGYSLNTCIDATIEPYWNKTLGNLDKNFFYKLILFSYSLFFINFVISFLYLRILAYLVVAGSILCLLYSLPPVRLKNNVIFNHVLNSSGFAILFIIGFLSVSKKITVDSVAMAMFFTFLFIPLQIVHQISHCMEEGIGGVALRMKTFKSNIWHFFIFSLALIILWILLMGEMINSKYIYYLYPTSLFVVLFIYFMRKIIISKEIDISEVRKVRFIFRKICIVYGFIVYCIYFFLK